ncbi:MAG: hypothetical protein HY646_02140 [Acidobacteria bacterium]|nr:hypothetical protein [Acidobacteriota bacterium]
MQEKPEFQVKFVVRLECRQTRQEQLLSLPKRYRYVISRQEDERGVVKKIRHSPYQSEAQPLSRSMAEKLVAVLSGPNWRLLPSIEAAETQERIPYSRPVPGVTV